jgi:hypothetical protein
LGLSAVGVGVWKLVVTIIRYIMSLATVADAVLKNKVDGLEGKEIVRVARHEKRGDSIFV